MKNKRYHIVILVWFLLLYPLHLFGAQSKSIKQFAKVDSLGSIMKYEEMDVVIDSIISQNDIKTGLKALQIRAYYYGEANKNVEAVQICLDVLEKLKQEELPYIEAKTNITLALIHEKTGNFTKCKNSLENAFQLIQNHQIDSIKPYYYLRLSSYYFRAEDNKKIALRYAKESLRWQKVHPDYKHKADALMLLGILNTDKNETKEYFRKSINSFKKIGNNRAIAIMFINISSIELNLKEPLKALEMNDSSLVYLKKIQDKPLSMYYRQRADIFYVLKNYDSAYVNEKEYSNMVIQENISNQQEKISQIVESYENEKNRSIIEQQKIERQKQITINILLAVLITIISVFTFYYYRSYQKIKKSSTTIQEQSMKLKASLEEKELLLKEVNHRVKNNLQTIISLLQIQGSLSHESNPEQFIKSGINRIHAMAILHESIFNNENINEIHVQSYLEQICRLANQSYADGSFKVQKEIISEIDILPLKSLTSLGLICLELITNSHKHAYKNNSSGSFSIQLKKETKNNFTHKLTYTDNGKGFDYEKVKQGAGYEIINGMVDQLKGEIIISNTNKFKVEIYLPSNTLNKA